MFLKTSYWLHEHRFDFNKAGYCVTIVVIVFTLIFTSNFEVVRKPSCFLISRICLSANKHAFRIKKGHFVCDCFCAIFNGAPKYHSAVWATLSVYFLLLDYLILYKNPSVPDLYSITGTLSI